MTPFDLGDMPALTAGFRPFTANGGETGPGTSDARPGPRVDDIDRANAATLGHLGALVTQMQNVAELYGCPDELAVLIERARQLTDWRRAA